MATLAWATDVHLNFLTDDQLESFCDELVGTRADAVLLTGDIAEAPSLSRLLDAVARAVARPVYFVLGNHDYYFGSIPAVRDEVRALCRAHSGLRWLPDTPAVRMSDTTALIGHGGWGDARLGNFRGSPVMLNDYRLIEELAGIGLLERERRLYALGDEAAAHAERALREALAVAPRVVFATHVPPFRDACWHEGAISNDDWLPHFTCKAVGDALVRVMEAHPDHALTVLCGHTHSPGEAAVLPNLRVVTGAADYGSPAVAAVLTL